MKRKIRLLIVSVGSLVGQNILDSLEYSNLNRRNLVEITGTNSLSLTANNFRCDECFLVPPTASPAYKKHIVKVIKKVAPDIIFSARDEDTVALKKIMDENPSLPGKLPYGSLVSVELALDKWKSFLFCEANNLPFAESFNMTSPNELTDLKRFTDRVGYPLIAKPIKGFASKGVFFVRTWDEVLFFVKKKGYMFQEYLGDSCETESYFNLLEGPKPLFAEMPGISHHTCHIPINSKREIGEIFVLKNHHNFGAVTQLQRVIHPELENIASDFAKAFIKEGGVGPLSVQFRADKHGRQKAQEMNLRTTGSTFPRLMMGQDEVGVIVNDLLEEIDFPIYKPGNNGCSVIITKTLYSYASTEKDKLELEEKGHWSSS